MNGFELFSTMHVLWLAICLILTAAVLAAGGHAARGRGSGSRLFGRALAICALVLHLAESGFRICEGSYGIDTLPLHVCALCSYLVLIHNLHPGRATGEILFCPGIAGALAALLFPDWTGYAPFSFLSAAGFLSHTAIIIYVLYALRIGLIRPSVKRAYIPVIFCAVYAAVIIPFNRHFEVNYGFLAAPSPDSPLEPLAHLSGEGAGYLAAYAALALIVIALSYALYTICTRPGRRA